MDNLRQVARMIRSDGVAAAMAGPWAESPLFAASFEVPGIREKVAEIVADFPGAEYLATSRDAVDRDWKIPDRLAEIKAPTIVLNGERDMPGFRAFADEAASGIPGAIRREIPGAGHLLPLEAPDAVVQAVLEI
jgi:pimeloyl-ACP methyl ester carboxylesterase